MTYTQWKRRQRRRAAYVVLAVFTAGSVLGVAMAGAEAPAAKAPVYKLLKSNFGINAGSGFFLDDAHLSAGLDDLKNLGVHWIRATIPWQNFQPNDPTKLPAGASQYNWKSVDGFAAKVHLPQYAGRFGFIVTVESPPDWAKAPKRIGRIPCAMQPPFDLASYARATAALAVRLRTTAHVFELQNSPNIGRRGAAHDNPFGVWPVPNPCGYAQLLKLTTPAVRATRVGATVLVGGIGGVKDIAQERISGDRFLAALYANGARGFFDGVSYHPYSTPHLPCAPSAPVCIFNPRTSGKDPYGMKNGWDRMLNARRIMVANGDSARKIWITEFGGPTNGPQRSDQVLTDTQQATLLAAGFARASQQDWVGPMCWFTYKDDVASPQSDPTGSWMGLLRANGSRKPAYSAYRYLAAVAH